MENKSVLNKIKSKYILLKIFSFIENSDFLYSFFVYNKSFQQKLDLELVDYERAYLEKFGIDFRNYVFCERNRFQGGFDKNLLKRFLENDILKNNLDLNLIQKIIVDIYKKIDKVYKDSKEPHEDNEKENLIDIYSPFFDFLSKTELFHLFSIFISAYIIEKFDLSNDYIAIFEKLNKLNSKYSSITFYYKDSQDIDYLKQLNINFGQIKRLHFKIDDFFETKNYDYFFKTFFSLDNLENSLVILDLDIKWMKYSSNYQINTKLIEKLNNFKQLKYLHINGLILTANFELNLSNLITLYLENSENITFEEKSCANLKVLKLIDCSINQPKSIIEIENLEECELVSPKTRNFFSIFNFSKCKKLKHAIMDPCDFIYLEDTCLELITLISNIEVDIDIKKKTFEKLISLKSLKKIEFEFGKINNDELSLIKGENSSVEAIKFNFVKTNADLIIYNLEKKFPNLTELNIKGYRYSDNDLETDLEIEENDKCKINTIFLDIAGFFNLKLFCISFENLIEIKIGLRDKISHLENTFPLFNPKCNVIFKALNYFCFYSDVEEIINVDILKNLFNNLNKIPNVKKLFIDCFERNIDEEFYQEFVRKILSLQFRDIHFSIRPDLLREECPYSKDELLEIYPNIDFSKYENIYIYNLNNENNAILRFY